MADREAPSARKTRLERLLTGYERAREAARELLSRRERLTASLEELTARMALGFLYDRERKLFAIGYDVTERRLDTSYYDLLASEARVVGFMAIARGEVPLKHWAALGRPFGMAQGEPVLLSWNGTLFEYLMPALFQELFPGSLLAYACRRAVEIQRDYARRRGIPWGISEAAFSALDAYQIYQYRAFGVPGLGLKRGLEEDLVVAPYATALALAVDPVAAVMNLRRLARYGLRGPYGFYEAIDFTRERCPAGERGVIVYAYMAHHQGMSLVSLANALLDGIMRRRFHADPRVKAAEPVLYERVPTEPPPAILPGGEGPPPRILP
ncbi:MAG: glycosyl transferase, partial [Firmicutes bacterium]|nr:glycosyl transferase [Bacillota bacterium]